MRDDLDLAITGLGDLNVLPEVTDTAFDLDAVVQELLEGGDVEDLVAGRLGSVDHELLRDLLRLLRTSLYKKNSIMISLLFHNYRNPPSDL